MDDENVGPAGSSSSLQMQLPATARCANDLCNNEQKCLKEVKAKIDQMEEVGDLLNKWDAVR
jgi:hypothetical protein